MPGQRLVEQMRGVAAFGRGPAGIVLQLIAVARVRAIGDDGLRPGKSQLDSKAATATAAMARPLRMTGTTACRLDWGWKVMGIEIVPE